MQASTLQRPCIKQSLLPIAQCRCDIAGIVYQTNALPISATSPASSRRKSDLIHNAIALGIPTSPSSADLPFPRNNLNKKGEKGKRGRKDSHNLVSLLHSLERLPSFHQPKLRIPRPSQPLIDGPDKRLHVRGLVLEHAGIFQLA